MAASFFISGTWNDDLILKRPGLAQVPFLVSLRSALVAGKFRMRRMLIDLLHPSFSLQLAHMCLVLFGFAGRAALYLTHELSPFLQFWLHFIVSESLRFCKSPTSLNLGHSKPLSPLWNRGEAERSEAGGSPFAGRPPCLAARAFPPTAQGGLHFTFPARLQHSLALHISRSC
jgi:hypothetical protein